MATSDEAYASAKAAHADLEALEERAGIHKKVEDARLGPMFPDLEASADEYFREAEDHARRRVRNLYFAVEDQALRKELIGKRRECDRAHDTYLQHKAEHARQTLLKAQQRADALPWLWAGCLAALFVAAGARYFQLYGAIGGALLGFFAGQGTIASARTERADAVRTAKADLDEELEGIRENALCPDWFNGNEQRTGERDETFDNESVIANYYTSKRAAGQT